MSAHPFTRRARRWLAVLPIAGLLCLAGCAEPAEVTAKKADPVKIEKIPGTDVKRLTLDATAAERMGIQTHTVEAVPGSELAPGPMTVPYGAVLYDAKGATFVYTNPEPQVFVRHPITVDRIDGAVALLTAGPPLGTPVVTIGGPELIGIEFGVGK